MVKVQLSRVVIYGTPKVIFLVYGRQFAQSQTPNYTTILLIRQSLVRRWRFTFSCCRCPLPVPLPLIPLVRPVDQIRAAIKRFDEFRTIQHPNARFPILQAFIINRKDTQRLQENAELLILAVLVIVATDVSHEANIKVAFKNV